MLCIPQALAQSPLPRPPRTSICLSPLGKTKKTCPAVKSIPFETNRGKHILKQMEGFCRVFGAPVSPDSGPKIAPAPPRRDHRTPRSPPSRSPPTSGWTCRWAKARSSRFVFFLRRRVQLVNISPLATMKSFFSSSEIGIHWNQKTKIQSSHFSKWKIQFRF